MYIFIHNANQELKKKEAEAILAKRKATNPEAERTLEAL